MNFRYKVDFIPILFPDFFLLSLGVPRSIAVDAPGFLRGLSPRLYSRVGSGIGRVSGFARGRWLRAVGGRPTTTQGRRRRPAAWFRNWQALRLRARRSASYRRFLVPEVRGSHLVFALRLPVRWGPCSPRVPAAGGRVGFLVLVVVSIRAWFSRSCYSFSFPFSFSCFALSGSPWFFAFVLSFLYPAFFVPEFVGFSGYLVVFGGIRAWLAWFRNPGRNLLGPLLARLPNSFWFVCRFPCRRARG